MRSRSSCATSSRPLDTRRRCASPCAPTRRLSRQCSSRMTAKLPSPLATPRRRTSSCAARASCPDSSRPPPPTVSSPCPGNTLRYLTSCSRTPQPMWVPRTSGACPRCACSPAPLALSRSTASWIASWLPRASRGRLARSRPGRRMWALASIRSCSLSTRLSSRDARRRSSSTRSHLRGSPMARDPQDTLAWCTLTCSRLSTCRSPRPPWRSTSRYSAIFESVWEP
mmetsp:Transcript_4397/g.12385  ORF Transcript_4397/g.12385 Transcript_4397/m.12385 type:complete len:226 (+) Transcript_4397:1259-1936(+)